MVTRKRTVKVTGTRRRAVKPTARHAPTVLAVPPETVSTMRARVRAARRTFETTTLATGKFARSSLREVRGAVRASREPLMMVWRNVRLAGRHIVREATTAWHEVVPAGKRVLKLPIEGARRPAA